jgi:PAS domain S-box-containing protein
MIHHSFELDRLIQSPLALGALGTACLLICLGIIAVKREQGSAGSLTFLKLDGTIGLWLFGFSWMYASSDIDSAYWWAKTAYIGLALIPVAAMELNTLTMQDFQNLRKTIRFIRVTSVFFLVVILATDYQFSSMYRYDWGFYPRYTLTSIPFLVYFFGTLILVFSRYVEGYRAKHQGELQRKQRRLAIFAFIVSSIGFMDFLPSFGIAIYPLGFGAIIIFALILFYMTLRYQFIAITPSLTADSIIQIIDDGLMVIDNEGLIRIANNALGRLFRAGEKPIIGVRPSEVMADVKGLGAKLENLQLQDELRNFEIDHQDEEGITRSFSVASSIIHDQHDEQLAIVCVIRDITQRKKAGREREQLISQLQEALANVRQLSGMLPICSVCKKIRDDQGYWQQLESFIRDKSDVEFSHSMCPECEKKFYAHLEQSEKNQKT